MCKLSITGLIKFWAILILLSFTGLEQAFCQTNDSVPQPQVTVTLLDGIEIYADSIFTNDTTYYLYRLSQLKQTSKHFRSLEFYEIFSVKDHGRLSIIYESEEGTWNSFEMESFIQGRQIAQREFKKWPYILAGGVSGFLVGGYFGNSLIGIGSSFGVAFTITKIPIFKRGFKSFENPLTWLGYKQEMQDNRFIPFLFANLAGVLVGLSQAKNL